jgi:hypothetical protein
MIAVTIIFPAKADVAFVDGHQAVVGDGDAVCVSPDIAENLLRSREGWLGIGGAAK